MGSQRVHVADALIAVHIVHTYVLHFRCKYRGAIVSAGRGHAAKIIFYYQVQVWY